MKLVSFRLCKVEVASWMKLVLFRLCLMKLGCVK